MDKATAIAAIEDRFARCETEDLYAFLDLSNDASADELRASYRALARTFHIDRLGRLGLDDATQTKLERVLARLSEAQQTLTNAQRREAYDADLTGGGQVTAAEMEAIFAAEEAFRRGKLNLERGQYDAALKKFRQVVEVNPDDPTSLAYLHFATFVTEPVDKRGRRSESANTALKRLQKLADDNDKLGTPMLLCGKALKLTGDAKGAERMFKRVMRLEPKNADAERELRLIKQRAGQDEPQGGGFMDKLRGLFKK